MITLTRGEVALLELDNQPLNLVTVAMMEQLDEALDRARGRPRDARGDRRRRR